MTPRISILLPFRDAAATVGRAVGSVLGQTFPDWELIAVDDGSADDSVAEIRRACRGDPRVRVVANVRRPGIVGALQSAVGAARAAWLGRMDADDRCHPERFERQWAMTGQADLIACAVTLVDPLGEGMQRYVDWTNALPDHTAMAHARFVENPVVHPSVLMRRESFDAVGGYRDCAWAEDHDLWLRLLEGGARFVKVPERLLEWRDSPGRLTRSDPRYSEALRQRMRAHFLARLDPVKARGVAIAGAGPIGKSLCRELQAEGVAVRGFFDVHPRRIGERIHGAEVRGLGDFGCRWRDAVLLSAVGLPGVREEIAGLAAAAGYREGEDFWAVC